MNAFCRLANRQYVSTHFGGSFYFKFLFACCLDPSTLYLELDCFYKASGQFPLMWILKAVQSHFSLWFLISKQHAPAIYVTPKPGWDRLSTGPLNTFGAEINKQHTKAGKQECFKEKSTLEGW